MEYKTFLNLISKKKEISNDMSEAYKLGIDLLEYPPLAKYESIIDSLLKELYNTEGIDWINWFMYESDFGERDFSKSQVFELNDEGNMIKVDDLDKSKYGAHDENGKPICYSIESLYDYVVQYEK